MFIRSAHNYDTDVVSYQSGLDCSDSPSRTQQHFRDETDINVMIKRFQGVVPPAPPVPPGVQDFSNVYDFQSAMQVVIDARVAFGQLPSDVRDRFRNDPARFLAFVHDASNRDEAVRLGLVPRETAVSGDSSGDTGGSNSPVDGGEPS